MRKIFYLMVLIPTFMLSQNPYVVNTKEKAKKEVKLSIEEKFIKDNFEYLFIADWYKGMRFMVKEKRSWNSDINLYPYNSKQRFINRLNYSDFEYKIFTVQDVEEKIVNCPKGKCTRTYVVFECEGKRYKSHEMSGSKEELRQEKIVPFSTINHLVYIDEIDKVKSLLLDKTLFTLTDLWYEDSDSESGHNIVEGLKYEKVKIINVGIGSFNWPVKLVFETDDGNQYFIEMSFSGINNRINLDFKDIFSFENPRIKYPNISNENWNLIKQSKVKVGMTKEECELSWGKPDDINETIYQNYTSEQWIYSNNYLYFKKNILETIQD